MKKHRIGIYTNPSVSYADSSLEKGAYEMLTFPLDKGSDKIFKENNYVK